MANSNFKVRTGLSIGDSVSISDAGVATGLTSMTGLTTVDTTNVEATNIKSKDGSASIVLADSTGIVTIGSQLNVDNINISTNTISSTDTNGLITLDPNGSGSIELITATSGGASGNVYIGAKQTGSTTSNASGNIVRGAIRDSTTLNNGDIWSFVSGTGTGTRGVSVDNAENTAKGPWYVARSYSGGAVSGSGTRGRVLFEKARGTPATPTAVVSGDLLASVDATGYLTDRWLSDCAAVVPSFFGFTAAETWANTAGTNTITNAGTNFSVTLAPSATTISSSANLIPVISISPQSATIRSDSFSFQQGKSGTTILLNLATTSSSIRSDVLNFLNSAGSQLNSSQIVYSRTYGEFAYTNAAGFAIAAQNTIYAMPIDTTNYSNNTSTSNTSRINITKTGKYKIIMSLQAAMATNSIGQFDFWLRKNGADVANSKTQVDLLKDQKSVIAMDWMVDCTATTDYWEIVYASSSANYANITFPTIAATSSPYVSPAAPALLVNVIPVGM
jgi:hypothetical protein